MDKGVLYLRLSKEDIDKIRIGDESESIMNQRLLLTDFAVGHEIQIVDVYSDDDFSGLYDDRPEFDRLIKDSRLGKFNVVIAKSQSRFTRNMEHMEKYLHHDFPLLGIRFIGVVDGVDTNIKGNKKARQIYGLTNEWYCEDLSENIRSVFKQKMRNGQFIGAFAPYGYIKSPEDRHQLIVDEPAALVVRRIFELYLKGYSAKQICYTLQDEGIPNPTLYKKQQGLTYANKKSEEFGEKYNLWSETTVKRMIGNETYIGKLVQGTCEKVSYKDKKVAQLPKEKWIVVENHHEPVIDFDTFQKAGRLKTKRRVSALNQNGIRLTHLFAGKIRCADCGSTMIKSGGVRGKKDDWYLRCQLANKSRKKECTSHNIMYSDIQEQVLKSIQTLICPILENEADRREIIDFINRESQSMDIMQEKEKHLQKLVYRLNSQKKAIGLLYGDRARGILTEDMFLQLKDDFQAEYQKIKLEIQQIEKETGAFTLKNREKKNEKELLDEYCDYSRLTHEIVVDFIDYIEVFEKGKEAGNQRIIIHWNI